MAVFPDLADKSQRKWHEFLVS